MRATEVIPWTHYRCPTINILDDISSSVYIFLMGKTIISNDNRFEWDEDKNHANIEKHGIDFEEILEVFDDPAFLTGYDFEHSEKEDRYYGIGNLNGILIVLVFFTGVTFQYASCAGLNLAICSFVNFGLSSL